MGKQASPENITEGTSWISSHQKINFCCLSRPVWGTLSQQPKYTKIYGKHRHLRNNTKTMPNPTLPTLGSAEAGVKDCPYKVRSRDWYSQRGCSRSATAERTHSGLISAAGCSGRKQTYSSPGRSWGENRKASVVCFHRKKYKSSSGSMLSTHALPSTQKHLQSSQTMPSAQPQLPGKCNLPSNLLRRQEQCWFWKQWTTKFLTEW